MLNVVFDITERDKLYITSLVSWYLVIAVLVIEHVVSLKAFTYNLNNELVICNCRLFSF